MKTSGIPKFEKYWFDGEKYINMQKNAILDRISKFKHRLYLEIWGKFLYDPHAARVLPGFFPDSKKQIFSSLRDKAEIIFCLNAKDLYKNRQLSNEDIDYGDYCLQMIIDIEKEVWIKPKISINRVSEKNKEVSISFKNILLQKWYIAALRYEIPGYPNDTEKVLSSEGYWAYEYIKVEKDLILVTWAASSSGKMSTCLWQIYHEVVLWQDSGYAKYETFPIWNLPLEHPVNLAYEAATADIGDYNTIDTYHQKAYSMNSVNYNRDVEAFEIVSRLSNSLLPIWNFTREYKSPTDMGINTAWFCITDDEVVRNASIAEIDRRINWYNEVIQRWEGDLIWIERCNKIKERL